MEDLKPRSLQIRMLNTGRLFYLMVHLVMPEDYPCRRVGELDALRRLIGRSLAGFHPRLVVDAVVTADMDYAAGMPRPRESG